MQIGTSIYKYGDGTEKAKIHLVSDAGMVLTQNGSELWNCVDVDSVDGWHEIPEPELPEED